MPSRHLRFAPVLVCLAVPVLAQDASEPTEATPEPREWIGGAPFWSWTRLTGDWAGYRTQLEQLGIEVAGGYTADWAAPWSGGLRQRDAFVSLLDLNVALDLEVLAGLPRTRLYLDAYRVAGRGPGDDIGDAQGVSNIAADHLEQLAEAWVETYLFDSLRVKLGKVDFNSEFAFNEIGGDFVNSTAAITPTIVAYPTYPDPATSINVFYAPDPSFYVGFGIYDGAAADGIGTGRRGFKGFFESSESKAYLLAAEVGTAWQGGETWGSGRLALGLWHHTAHFTTFDGGDQNGTQGLWLTAEQHVWRENPSDDDGQGLGVFCQFGLADDDVSSVGSTFALGAAWTGALTGRDHDVLGLGVFQANLSNAPLAGTPGNETTLELFYKLQATPAFSLKPELQYVIHPGGVPGVDDALVGLLRFEVLF